MEQVSSLPALPSHFQRLSLTVDETAAVTGLGRTTIYGLMKSGQLPKVKLGGRTLIRTVDL
jgi:excisionase family DNA binding protein